MLIWCFLELSCLNGLELPNGGANISGSFPSSIDPNALTANIFAEPDPQLMNELWGDLGLDLNDPWGLPGSSTDWMP